MKLIDVYTPLKGNVQKSAISILYSLLEERTSEESISHKGMPSLANHSAFILSKPYLAWYFIEIPDIKPDEFIIVGGIYLTKQREIGVSIFNTHRRQGYGLKAIKLLMGKHPGEFLANINPANEKSIELFTELGFKHIQNTYRHE